MLDLSNVVGRCIGNRGSAVVISSCGVKLRRSCLPDRLVGSGILVTHHNPGKGVEDSCSFWLQLPTRQPMSCPLRSLNYSARYYPRDQDNLGYAVGLIRLAKLIARNEVGRFLSPFKYPWDTTRYNRLCSQVVRSGRGPNRSSPFFP